MRLGQTILQMRKERNMTQEEFAQIFHVTRQTVSNWEKEKNYPDLETLIYMSDEWGISLDVMLKEDKQVAKKLNMEINFSKNFKRNALIVLAGISILLAVGAVVWGMAWKNAKDRLEGKFKEGIETKEFFFDEGIGYYKKMVGQDSYYTLPNQSMPDYFDFVLHFYNTSLDYYTDEGGENIQIRWSEGEEGVEHKIYYLDKHSNLEYTLSGEQEEELCRENPAMYRILKEGNEIYELVY